MLCYRRWRSKSIGRSWPGGGPETLKRRPPRLIVAGPTAERSLPIGGSHILLVQIQRNCRRKVWAFRVRFFDECAGPLAVERGPDVGGAGTAITRCQGGHQRRIARVRFDERR